MDRNDEIKKGMTIRVLPFSYSQHLSGGALVSPPKVRNHNGYRSVVVADVYPDPVGGEDMIDVFVGQHGDVDTVPASACRVFGWKQTTNERGEKVIVNPHGTQLDFAAALQSMDDDLREELALNGPHGGEWDGEAEFFAAYADAHHKRFGEEWELAKANPVW